MRKKLHFPTKNLWSHFYGDNTLTELVRKKNDTDKYDKILLPYSIWYNSNILHTLKVNLTRKAHFSEVQENKFSFINSTIMKSFKTMDLSTIKSF